MFRWDGSIWNFYGLDNGYAPFRLWGADADNIWGISAEGTIIRWDGNGWHQKNSGTGQDFFGNLGC